MMSIKPSSTQRSGRLAVAG